jgi:xanthine dehydrogenase YagR molybdenum-binding subunit
MAQSHWPSVIYPPSSCEVRITGDGSVEAFSASQDIGTGTRTVLAQVVAEELGLEARDIGAHIGDTRYPIGPPSGGSRVTGSLTPAARNAAYRAARDLAARLATALGVAEDAVVFADGHAGVRGNPATWLPFKEAVKKAYRLSHRAERREDTRATVERRVLGRRDGIGGVQFAGAGRHRRRRRQGAAHRRRSRLRPAGPWMLTEPDLRRRDQGLSAL